MLNVQAGTVTIIPSIQAITLPKFRLNCNVLSLLSIIVLGLMLFTATYAIAQVCQSEAAALNRAQKAHAASGSRLVAAEIGLLVAIASGNLIAVGVATVLVLSMMQAHDSTGANLTAAYKAYYDCLAKHGGG